MLKLIQKYHYVSNADLETVLCSYIYILALGQFSCTHTARGILCNTAPRSFKQNTAITWI